MHETRIERPGTGLYGALRTATAVDPLTDRDPSITIEAACRIQSALNLDRQVGEGETNVNLVSCPSLIMRNAVHGLTEEAHREELARESVERRIAAASARRAGELVAERLLVAAGVGRVEAGADR